MEPAGGLGRPTRGAASPAVALGGASNNGGTTPVVPTRQVPSSKPCGQQHAAADRHGKNGRGCNTRAPSSGAGHHRGWWGWGECGSPDAAELSARVDACWLPCRRLLRFAKVCCCVRCCAHPSRCVCVCAAGCRALGGGDRSGRGMRSRFAASAGNFSSAKPHRPAHAPLQCQPLYRPLQTAKHGPQPPRSSSTRAVPQLSPRAATSHMADPVDQSQPACTICSCTIQASKQAAKSQQGEQCLRGRAAAQHGRAAAQAGRLSTCGLDHLLPGGRVDSSPQAPLHCSAHSSARTRGRAGELRPAAQAGRPTPKKA